MNLRHSANQVLERIKSRTPPRTDREQKCSRVVYAPFQKNDTREHNYLTKKTIEKGSENRAFSVNSSVNIAVNKPNREWDPDEKNLIAWFAECKNLPHSPYELKAAVTIIDSQKFYDSLRMDIQSGPNSARARYGALQQDLQCLKKITEDLNES